MIEYLTTDDVDVAGANVLVRSDLNVPLDDGVVSDDFRIQAALPTLQALVENGAAVTVCSHLGRPQGPDPTLSLRPVAEHMATLTNLEVGFEAGGQITVRENTRFLEGEISNDPNTARSLAEGFDLFIQDAFGTVHRAHASTVGVAELVRSVAGPLLDAELSAFGRFLTVPERPYTVVLGGAKVSDKLAVIDNLLPQVDHMLIGGGMCFTFLKANGHSVGTSLVEESMLASTSTLMTGVDGHKLELPSDIVVTDRFAEDATSREVAADHIPGDWMGLDIGKETARAFSARIRGSASVFWNGPMGVFEWEPFRHGTEAVARGMAKSRAFTAVGGGDSAAAMRLLGLEDSVSHLSTGGGAGLQLLEGRVLPGVAVLERWVR